MLFPGWTVVRAIPFKVWAGLLIGQYTLSGGVIRHAAGTIEGGQIVAHLLPAGSSLLNIVPGLNFIPGLIANVQLHSISEKIGTLAEMTQLNTYKLVELSGQVNALSQATQHVIYLAAGTALLSGLSLAVSSIGFVVVNKKLHSIDEKLNEIKKDVQAIKDFLERGERAELRAALKDLLKLENMTNPTHRDKILNDRRQTLMKLHEKYQELLAHAHTLETAIANEEYFSLTGLAYSRCTAELGMITMACQEINEMCTFWNEQAHRIVNELLIGDYPERFLASDFAEDVPISAIATWLDFARDEKKGYLWIDELRKKIDEPWYKRRWEKLTKGGGLNRSIGVGLDQERDVIIPTLQKFIARSHVFEGYVSQYDMFATHEMKP